MHRKDKRSSKNIVSKGVSSTKDLEGLLLLLKDITRKVGLLLISKRLDSNLKNHEVKLVLSSTTGISTFMKVDVMARLPKKANKL